MKKLAILGSTGSIGTQTLEVVREQNQSKERLVYRSISQSTYHEEAELAGKSVYHEIKVAALAANSNIELLEKQVREFLPDLVCVYREEKAARLKESLGDLAVRVVSGMDGLIECATLAETDTAVIALVGMIGIRPTIEAIKAGKRIALANKETLVCAGHLIMPLVKEKNVELLPVDSEHCAIFQALNGEDKKKASKILLTASGGPFRGKRAEELGRMTARDALKHPNWTMGPKITVDSATMVNKGLEVMEAAWLFGMSPDDIQVVVHPQSIIHSMVEYVDGSIIAQLGVPDMKLPIRYALFYPERMPAGTVERLDFAQIKQLTFEEPDMETFSGLRLAYEAGRIGGSMPTVFNAANEWAVAEFLKGGIGFLMIPALIGKAMKRHRVIQNPCLDDILNTERETYDFIRGLGKD